MSVRIGPLLPVSFSSIQPNLFPAKLKIFETPVKIDEIIPPEFELYKFGKFIYY